MITMPIQPCGSISNQYTLPYRLEILAGSMASLGRGSGRACGNPNESQTNMFSKPRVLASSSHQMSHEANLITLPGLPLVFYNFHQFSSCSIQECTKVDCSRLTLYQWAGLQHHRGVNCGDLHSVASEGTLKGHIRSHQVTK